jgi:response regulator of citrate/malate metabolism
VRTITTRQKEKIMNILKKHPEGLTIQKISDILGMSRITATKYIHELIGEKRVYQRKVGVAKLCYAKDRFVEMVNQKEVLDKLKKKIG